MKILFITYTNPLKSNCGDSVYTMDILSGMRKLDCYIKFLSFNCGEFKEDDLSKLGNYCDEISLVPFIPKRKIMLCLSLYPFSIANRRSKDMVRKVNKILETEEYDYIVINHFKLSYLSKSLNKGDFKKVFISHNVETNLSKSLYRNTSNWNKAFMYYLEYLKVKIFERKYLKGMDVITAISDLDHEFFKNQFTRSEVYFLPPRVRMKSLPQDNKVGKKVILCGSFCWEPKKENLIRLLHAKNFNKISENGIGLLIVGNAPENLISRVNSRYEGVKMLGFVADNKKFYEQSKIAIVPELLGGGFKMKIAEAVSYNRAMVAIRVAITDNQMIDGVHYVGADSFEEMIDAVIELIHDQDKIEDMARNARELFADKYSSKTIDKTLSNIFT